MLGPDECRQALNALVLGIQRARSILSEDHEEDAAVVDDVLFSENVEAFMLRMQDVVATKAEIEPLDVANAYMYIRLRRGGGPSPEVITAHNYWKRAGACYADSVGYVYGSS